MKNLSKLLILVFLLTKCSSDNSTTVVDKKIEKPIAVADFYTTKENQQLIITNLLENDTKQTTTKIISFTATTSKNGTVVLNSDGSYTYTPKTDFFGTDTFTYTICNDVAKKQCSTATVTITVKEEKSNVTVTFNIPDALKSYYTNLKITDNKSENRKNLRSIVKNGYTALAYTDRHQYLYKADADLNNSNNVLLMYTGESRSNKEYKSGSNSHPTQTFNTEHVYPKSLLSTAKSRTDLHHLRSCDISVNSKRGNKGFTDGSGNYTITNNKWFPGDEWKGDVARMVFYLNLLHNESIDKVGNKALFLKWNIEDPVSAFEAQRNKEIQKAQGNRNPFIDNPYLVTLIYGGNNAENKWK